jgi:hypothetical protein
VKVFPNSGRVRVYLPDLEENHDFLPGQLEPA